MQWQVQEAKAQFSEVARHAVDEGAQIVTRHGEAYVVVVSIEEWRRLSGQTTDLRDFLFSGGGRPAVDEDAEQELDAILAGRGADLGRDLDAAV